VSGASQQRRAGAEPDEQAGQARPLPPGREGLGHPALQGLAHLGMERVIGGSVGLAAAVDPDQSPRQGLVRVGRGEAG
jgi:hypothetical protein